MFAGGLLQAPNLLAVAAATPTEESFAAFCPPYDHVKSMNNRYHFVWQLNCFCNESLKANDRELGGAAEGGAWLQRDILVPRRCVLYQLDARCY